MAHAALIPDLGWHWHLREHKHTQTMDMQAAQAEPAQVSLLGNSSPQRWWHCPVIGDCGNAFLQELLNCPWRRPGPPSHAEPEARAAQKQGERVGIDHDN